MYLVFKVKFLKYELMISNFQDILANFTSPTARQSHNAARKQQKTECSYYDVVIKFYSTGKSYQRWSCVFV